MTTATRRALHTPLCDLLGIRYPICQAGMGWVARSGARRRRVRGRRARGHRRGARQSGLSARGDPPRARATDRPFGVDILFATCARHGDEAEQFTDQVKGWIDVTLEERVPVLIAGLGNPGAGDRARRTAWASR